MCAAVVLARTRDLGKALPVLLNFLLAARLLRLTSDSTWRALATAMMLGDTVGVGVGDDRSEEASDEGRHLARR